MKAMMAAAALAAGMTMATPAAAQDLCPMIARIVAASREPAPFASLGVGRTVVFPGYRADHCRIENGNSIVCFRNLAPRSLSRAVLDPAVQGCLETAPVRSERPRHETVFVAEGLRYEIYAECDERCRAGRITSLAITLLRADEPRRR